MLLTFISYYTDEDYSFRVLRVNRFIERESSIQDNYSIYVFKYRSLILKLNAKERSNNRLILRIINNCQMNTT